MGKKIKNRKEDLREELAEIEEEHQEFATFMIGEEFFGVDILKVRDIIGISDITPVPKSPRFIKGVINLRGNIVPVVDLRVKFKMEERVYDGTTVIIVVEVRGRFIGMIVDSVADVIDIKTEGIHKSPHYSANVREDFIQSIGKKEDRLIIILDVDRILNTGEMGKEV